MGRHCVGSVDDFEAEQVKVVRVAGERLCVVRHQQTFFAFEDRCSHDDGPLGGGRLEGCQIECPRHGARFDIRTGRVMAPPALTPIETYSVDQEENRVFVTFPD